MDHLFGKLRSLVHAEAPSPRTWRALLQALYPDHTHRRAEQLVPYLDDTLSARWPDHLRVTPQRWLRHAQATGQPHPFAPIARTLRAFAPHPSHPLLFNRRLAHITHVFAEGARDDLAPLLTSPGLTGLTRFEGRHQHLSPAALTALLTRHPTLTHLIPGRSAQLNTLPDDLHLPRLTTLDLTPLAISHDALHALLHPDALPALTDLRVSSTIPLPAAILPQLDRLHLTLHASPAALDTLGALTRATHLHLSGRLSEDTLARLAHTSGAQPHTLIIEGGGDNQLSAPPADAPWPLLREVRDLMLWRVHAIPALRALIDPVRHQLTHLHLHSCWLRGDDTRGLAKLLTEQPWPHLTTLRIERTSLSGLGLDPASLHRAFPSLQHIIVRANNAISDHDVAAISAAPWFLQLKTLDINAAYTPTQQHARHPILVAVADHPNLTHLGLCNAALTPQHIEQLCDTPLPHLQILRLGKVDGLTKPHLQHIAQARWLPQLTRLRLIARDLSTRRGWSYTPHPLQYVNTRALLLKAGLSRHATVQY